MNLTEVFSSGKIIQHLTSRQDFIENCLILISPDGKSVYYGANLIKTDKGETQEVSMDKEFSEESNLKKETILIPLFNTNSRIVKR